MVIHPNDEQLPAGELPPLGIPPIRTMGAVRMMVSHMLNFAAFSDHAYFNVGLVEEMGDGSLIFEFEGNRFGVEIDLLSGADPERPQDRDDSPGAEENGVIAQISPAPPNGRRRRSRKDERA